MSATITTGAETFSASNMLAISYFEILISTEDPAPSIIIISFSFLRLSSAVKTIGKAFVKQTLHNILLHAFENEICHSK